MQTVILAGGLGTRLRPLTEKIPKPMILVKDKPFLEHQLILLKKFDLKKIILCLSYLSNTIQDYFGDGSRWGLNIRYSIEEKPLGTGGALKKAEKYLQDHFLALNGDSYLPFDYHRFTFYFRDIKSLGLLAVYHNRKRIAPSNIALNHRSMVSEYNKREEKQSMHYIDAGVMIFQKRMLELIPPDKVVSLEEDIFPELIEMGELQAYPTEERYYDIGAFHRLKEIEEILE